jgi:ankyrin repeat protein
MQDEGQDSVDAELIKFCQLNKERGRPPGRGRLGNSDSLLKSAVCMRSAATMRALLEMNCDPNTEWNCYSPSLHHACQHMNENLVQMLLDAKASPFLVNKEGNTALHIAIAMGSLNIAKILVSHGAPVYCMNDEGETPLFKAWHVNNWNAVRFLLDSGLTIIDDNANAPKIVPRLANSRAKCKAVYLCMVGVMRKRLLFGHIQMVPDMVKVLASHVWASRFDTDAWNPKQGKNKKKK